jgi:hypothetical protein
MGFYLRKAFGFGPFRLNLSRSGLGVSFGVKGARIGVGPRGSYIHAGRGGIYYRQSLSLGAPRPRASPPAPTSEGLSEVESVAASELADSSADALLKELNRVQSRVQVLPIVVALVVLGLLVLMATFGSNESVHPFVRVCVVVLACFGGIAGLLYARHIDVTNGTAVMYFDLADGADQRFSGFLQKFATFSQCAKVWHIKAQGATKDWKRSAGANTLVDRQEIAASLSAPPRVQTNIDVPVLPAGRQTLYFFPDRLLVYEKAGVGAVRYSDLLSAIGTVAFREENAVPSDARGVGTTWRYVNKNGGPDRRFSNNREIPIVEYGQIQLSSRSGLNEMFQTSQSGAARVLAEALGALGQEISEGPRPKLERPARWRVIVDGAAPNHEAVRKVIEENWPEIRGTHEGTGPEPKAVTVGKGLSADQANSIMLKLHDLGIDSRKELDG